MIYITYVNFIVANIKSKCQLNTYLKQQVKNVKYNVVNGKYCC